MNFGVQRMQAISMVVGAIATVSRFDQPQLNKALQLLPDCRNGKSGLTSKFPDVQLVWAKSQQKPKQFRLDAR